jgi:hypothetical protein
MGEGYYRYTADRRKIKHIYCRQEKNNTNIPKTEEG